MTIYPLDVFWTTHHSSIIQITDPPPTDLPPSSIFRHFWVSLEQNATENQVFSQQMKPIISKGHSSGYFKLFSLLIFCSLQFKRYDHVVGINLYSRSSPTKLWKWIFDLRSQKSFFDTQSCHVRNFSRNGSMGNVKFESEISMKTFVSTKIFYVL